MNPIVNDCQLRPSDWNIGGRELSVTEVGLMLKLSGHLNATSQVVALPAEAPLAVKIR